MPERIRVVKKNNSSDEYNIEKEGAVYVREDLVFLYAEDLVPPTHIENEETDNDTK